VAISGKASQPVTAERIEAALDAVARFIIELGDEGPVVFPIYKRLKDELAKLEAEAELMAEIRERALRAKPQRRTKPRA